MTPTDERVLVLMPTARDGERTREALAAAGVLCAVCADMDALCREVGVGAGALLLTEEAITADKSGCLAASLKGQPPWSDLPLIVLARGGSADGHLRESMNATLVERPVKMRSLLSVLRAALRARGRQYEVRDHFAERERQAAALRENEERLQFALAAGRLGSWDVDLTTWVMNCSALCKENFGRPVGDPFPYQELMDSIHADDRERVRAAVRRAVEQRDGYDVEYRTVWPDGTTHWVMVRGRASYGDDGKPLRMTGVSLDVTDRRRNEEALKEADRRKDDFIALLAHELRNPLAPIRNGLQVLHRTTDQVTRERAQEMMDRQLTHMVRLIDDLLDVSRIGRSKMELRRERITLAGVIASAVETAQPAIDAAGHELSVTLPGKPVALDADLTRLAQVFSNLLANSAKYTPAGGRIELTARREGGHAVVTVRDNGIGIPADSLPTIFDMFSQVDRTIERSTGGLGIGLALVKGLVEMHGGAVSASSGGEGRGSEFVVRLPVAPVRAETPEPAERIGRPGGSGRRILVVDDNRDSAESMAEMLRLFGNEVSVAHDGIEAVERAEAVRPAVVLMDVGMPRMNGFDATRRIREQPWGRGVAVIALTGWGQDADRERSREAGCDGHLVKPVSLDDLTQLLNGLSGVTTGA